MRIYLDDKVVMIVEKYIYGFLFAIGAKIAYDREKDFFGRGVR